MAIQACAEEDSLGLDSAEAEYDMSALPVTPDTMVARVRVAVPR